MVVALVLLIGLVALGFAALRGWTYESRDPAFTLRDVFAPNPGARASHDPRHTEAS